MKNGPTSEPPPNVALSKQRVKEHYGLNPTLEKSMPPSAPFVKGSGLAKIDHAVADSTGAKFNEHSEDDIFNETFFM